MKTTKRLSIDFYQRDWTITVEGSRVHVQHSEPDAADTTTICRTCHSPWIDMAAQADGMPASVERICHALQQFDLHLQVSPAGQLQICQRSLQAFKEKF